MAEFPALPFADNVFMDPASSIAWDRLLQTEFLERLFGALREVMGPQFAEHRFYLYSPVDRTAPPASASGDPSMKILFFLSDESDFIPSHLNERYAAIFKAHLPYEVGDGRIFPFNLGYVRGVPRFEPLPVEARPLDLFFSGNLNVNRWPLYRALAPAARLWPSPPSAIRMLLRSPLHRLLRRDFSMRQGNVTREIVFTDGFAKGLSPAAYGRKLADSKIVLCPPGFVSTETFRHIEALRAGAIVISQPLPEVHFYRGGPFICTDNWEEGLAAAAALLADPAALARRQAQGIAWYNDILSERATAAFVAQSIDRAAARP